MICYYVLYIIMLGMLFEAPIFVETSENHKSKLNLLGSAGTVFTSPCVLLCLAASVLSWTAFLLQLRPPARPPCMGCRRTFVPCGIIESFWQMSQCVCVCVHRDSKLRFLVKTC